MASIRKETNSDGRIKGYRVRWRAHDRVERTKFFKRYEDARAFKTRTESDLATGRYIDPTAGRITLGEMFEKFVKAPRTGRRRGPLKASSEATYRQLARYFGVYGDRIPTPRQRTLAEVPINKITRDNVQTLLDQMDQEKAPTVQDVRRLLVAVFSYAKRRGLISENPAELTDAPYSEVREARVLTAQQIDRIADEIEEPYRALVLLLGYGGLRVGEALALQIGDVAWPGGKRVTVTKRVKEVPGRGLDFDKPKTKTSVRSVALPDFLGEELAAHVARHCEAGNLAAPLFPSSSGGYIYESNWRRQRFYPACERAGLAQAERTPRGKLVRWIEPPPHVHDLRHSATTLMASAGFTMGEAQAQLGHSHQTMTDRYRHLFPDDLAAKARALDAHRRRQSTSIQDAALDG